MEFTFTGTCSESSESYTLNIKDATAYGVYLTEHDNITYSFTDDVAKSDDGYPQVRTLVSDGSAVNYTYVKKTSKMLSVDAGDDSLHKLEYVGEFTVDGYDEILEFKMGGTYTVIINAVSVIFRLKV